MATLFSNTAPAVPASAPMVVEEVVGQSAAVAVGDIKWVMTQEYSLQEMERTVYSGTYLGVEIMRSVDVVAGVTTEWYAAIGVANSVIGRNFQTIINDIVNHG